MKFWLYLMMVLVVGIYWLSMSQSVPTPNLDSPGFCVQDNLHEQRLLTDTAYAHRHAAMEEQILANHRQGASVRVTEDYTLPVVFHIIHNGGPENISDEQVQAALVNLNEAFANVGYYDPTTGVDVQIDFCLAERDPDGNATTGINRVQSALTNLNYEDDDWTMKSLSHWSSYQYINIWIVREICGNDDCGIAGYAYLPSSHGFLYDGIVLEAEFVGTGPENSTYLVHEMGHYLGLYHTFRNGCENDNCLTDGDRICDTPPDNTTAKPPCDQPSNSCSTDEDDPSLNNPFRSIAIGGLGDQPDLIENYMDYSRKECYNQFTQGQKDRMQEVVAGIRSSLLQSQGCTEACLAPVIADFSANGVTVTLGTTVSFVNTSTNGDHFQWLVDGQVVDSTVNFDYTFLEEGQFEITLIVSSDYFNCPPDEYSYVITTFCPVEAILTPGGMIVEPGDSVTFTNLSENAPQISWQVEGIEVSDENTYTLQTNEPGLYTLCLVANDDFCSDERCVTIVANTPGTGSEQEICDNNLDEDGDGLIDCIDPDCECSEDECGVTFVQRFGQDGVSQENIFTSLIQNSNEGILIGGTSFTRGKNLGYVGTLTMVNSNGNLEWNKRIDFESGLDLITDLKLDGEGAIFGLSSNYAFRYDLNNDSFLWCKRLSGGLYKNIILLPESGNYLICGEQSGTLLAMELNQSTGEVLWKRTFTIDGMLTPGGLLKMAPSQGYFYSIGLVKNENNTGTNRLALSLFAPDGLLVFSKFYLSPIEEVDDQGGHDLFVENDGLVFSMMGRRIGESSSFSRTVKLMKVDFSGNPIWGRQYHFEGVSMPINVKMSKTSDGYLIYFYGTNQLISAKSLIVLKTDLQGDVQWASSYGKTDANVSLSWNISANALQQVGNQFYFIGSSGSDERGIVIKTNLDGTIDGACDFYQTLNVFVDTIVNPYVEDLSFDEIFLSEIAPSPGNPVSWEKHAVFEYICPPVACDTTCIYDFTVKVDSTYCNGDSLISVLEVCNTSEEMYQGDFSISFYDGDPRSNPEVNHLTTIRYPNFSLDSNSCQNLILDVPYPETTGYVLINDRGNYVPPFDPATILPLTGITECDYSNNVDSFTYESIVPDLYIGPDLTMCENEVLVLDAGPGFAEYRWNNGSLEQTTTITAPGAYWVRAVTSCGVVKTDLVVITLDAATGLEMESLHLCKGDTATLSVPPVDGYQYQWYPSVNLACDTCTTIEIAPDISQTFTMVAVNDNGCVTMDSIAINVTVPPALEMADNLVGCTPKSGFLFVEITEGIGPFEVQWSDGQIGFTATQLGSGTYTATVTDGNGCRSMTTASVIVEQVHFSALVYPEEISCFGESDGVIRVEAVEGGTAPYLYSLDGVDYQIDSTFTNLDPGNYTVWIRDAEDCTVTYSIEVEEPILLQLDIPEGLNIALGDSLQLEAQVSKPVAAYHWEPSAGLSCTDCPNPTVFPLLDTDYILMVEDQDGCIASVRTRIFVQQKRRVFIPNAFSPNGDGINDQLRIFCGPEVEEIESFRIYSRWGEMVHEAIHIQPNTEYGLWDGYLDGRVMKPAVFAYRAIVRYIDGTEEVMDGNVALIR